MRRLFLVAVVTASCTAGEGLEDVGLSGLAGAACRHARACGCRESFDQDTPPSCEEERLDDWPSPRSAALVLPDNPGPVFDPQCVDTLIDLVERADCDTDFARFWVEVPCAVYHGTRNIGDECEETPPVVSYCLPGLRCVAGHCEPGHVVGPAEMLPGPGEPCADFSRCDATAWCDSTGPDEPVCRRLAAVGEACAGHSECQSQYCPAAFCDERPGEGEACGAQQLCSEGLICLDDRCQGGAAACVPPSVY